MRCAIFLPILTVFGDLIGFNRLGNIIRNHRGSLETRQQFQQFAAKREMESETDMKLQLLRFFVKEKTIRTSRIFPLIQLLETDLYNIQVEK